jgi:group II intron reverse transcriptase/maturase
MKKQLININNTNLKSPKLIHNINNECFGTTRFLHTHKNEHRIAVHPTIRKQLKFDSKNRCTNAHEILSSSETLRIAYETIKSNPGNMVEGTDKKTLDGISESWFIETSRSLRNESYSPKPARRVYIPKPNGKLRPLGISSPRDKIVQQAMKLILESVLDNRFLDYSHGFRPNRGCHTALKEIRSWTGVAWVIEGDINCFFDSIDHHILKNLLKEHFSETRWINLYWKLVKAGYVEWDNSKKNYINALEGVPQGGIVSPILSNLILNELDKFLHSMIIDLEKKNKGKDPYIPNPKYHALSMKIYRLKKKIKNLIMNEKDPVNEKKTYLKLVKARRLLKSTTFNPEITRIKYVRYADDWLIGVWGNKKSAKDIKERISSFLSKLKLNLSLEKTLITNMRTERAKFLSIYIKRIASNTGPQKTYQYKGITKRIPTGGLWMTAAVPELIKRLIDKGFLKITNDRWKPVSIQRFLPLKPRDMILRYRSILNGIINYHSFVDNKPRLAKIYWVLKESLRKTICRKLMISGSLFLRKFGKNISIIEKNKSDKETTFVNFACPSLNRRPMLFYGKSSFWDPLTASDWKVSTRSAYSYPCASCNSTIDVEMHHLKHIKTINTKLNTFDKMVAEINRKQVPLCRNCHLEVHRGKYKGKSLKHLSR